MTRDDVIEMAREAGIPVEPAQFQQSRDLVGSHGLSNLESFAHIAISDFLKRTGQYVTNDASREAAMEQARAEEREACAKACDELFPPPGEQMAVEWAAGTIACANAIRARGQK